MVIQATSCNKNDLLCLALVVQIPYSRYQHRRSLSSSFSSSSLHSSSYGRGAEIWPPTNEGPIDMSSSFPNGKIPSFVIDRLQQNHDTPLASSMMTDDNVTTMTTHHSDIPQQQEGEPIVWHQRITTGGKLVDRILRRAARSEEENVLESTIIQKSVNQQRKLPIRMLVTAMALAWTLQPLDVILLSFFTGYYSILHLVARSTRPDGITPMLPALPPQGHVPITVANPLGIELTTYSRIYDRWLKLGIGIGFVAPLGILIYRCGLCFLLQSNNNSRLLLRDIHIIARPLIFLCAQVITESYCRSSPLPLRILVPVTYNTIRLGYLWNWALFQPDLAALGRISQFVGILNLVYWAVNLFAFLIPVATMKYLRAHFFCVEAESVVTRAGMEESIGLSPY